jgi:hypothetical protein
MEDRGDLAPAPPTRRAAVPAAAAAEVELGGPGLLATLLGVIPKARRQGLPTRPSAWIGCSSQFVTADATWLRGHGRGATPKPIAEPEISMTAAHAPGDHHHPPTAAGN